MWISWRSTWRWNPSGNLFWLQIGQNTSTCGLEFTPKQFGDHKNMLLEPWHGIGPAKLLLDDMNQQTLWDITYQKDPKSIAYSRLQYLYI